METDTYEKEYEISFLVQRPEGAEDVYGVLRERGAEIYYRKEPRKVALAYPIRKEHEGYFACAHFRVLPQVVGALEKELHMQGSVLRFLIVTPPFVREQQPQGVSTQEVRGRERRREEIPAPAELPLSNEALEKQIEKILQ